MNFNLCVALTFDKTLHLSKLEDKSDSSKERIGSENKFFCKCHQDVTLNRHPFIGFKDSVHIFLEGCLYVNKNNQKLSSP